MHCYFLQKKNEAGGIICCQHLHSSNHAVSLGPGQYIDISFIVIHNILYMRLSILLYHNMQYRKFAIFWNYKRNQPVLIFSHALNYRLSISIPRSFEKWTYTDGLYRLSYVTKRLFIITLQCKHTGNSWIPIWEQHPGSKLGDLTSKVIDDCLKAPSVSVGLTGRGDTGHPVLKDIWRTNPSRLQRNRRLRKASIANKLHHLL